MFHLRLSPPVVKSSSLTGRKSMSRRSKTAQITTLPASRRRTTRCPTRSSPPPKAEVKENSTRSPKAEVKASTPPRRALRERVTFHQPLCVSWCIPPPCQTSGWAAEEHHLQLVRIVGPVQETSLDGLVRW